MARADSPLSRGIGDRILTCASEEVLSDFLRVAATTSDGSALSKTRIVAVLQEARK